MFYIEHPLLAARGSTFDLDGDATNRPFHRSIEVFGAQFGETFRGSPLLPVALPSLHRFFYGLRSALAQSLFHFPQVFAILTVRVRTIW